MVVIRSYKIATTFGKRKLGNEGADDAEQKPGDDGDDDAEAVSPHSAAHGQLDVCSCNRQKCEGVGTSKVTDPSDRLGWLERTPRKNLEPEQNKNIVPEKKTTNQKNVEPEKFVAVVRATGQTQNQKESRVRRTVAVYQMDVDADFCVFQNGG